MPRQQSISTILIGKNALIREGIARLLNAEHFRIAASVSCADDLSDKLQSRHLLFLIVHTGDDFEVVLEQIELLRDKHPEGRIAIVADHCRRGELVSAFQAGANGYFFDITTCDAFIKSIELVMMGETLFPPTLLSFAPEPESVRVGKAFAHGETEQPILVGTEDAIAPQLSPREQSILHCLIEGYSNKGIARKIDIAEATVKAHVKAILRKIRVQNRTQAAIWGIHHGWLETPKAVSAHLSRDLNNWSGSEAEALSEVKRIAPPTTLGMIGDEASECDVARANGFLPKEINGRTAGVVRLRK